MVLWPHHFNQILDGQHATAIGIEALEGAKDVLLSDGVVHVHCGWKEGGGGSRVIVSRVIVSRVMGRKGGREWLICYTIPITVQIVWCMYTYIIYFVVFNAHTYIINLCDACLFGTHTQRDRFAWSACHGHHRLKYSTRKIWPVYCTLCTISSKLPCRNHSRNNYPPLKCLWCYRLKHK